MTHFKRRGGHSTRLKILSSAAITGLLIAVSTGFFASAITRSGPLEALSCSAALGQPLANEAPGIKGPIRMLSWNIQKSQTDGWDADLLDMGSDRDLLLIQEASTQAQISNTLPQPLYQAFAAGYTTKSQTTGVLTLSSIEPSLQCNLTAWEPWLGTPKATNITEYPIKDSAERLLVVNLHAVNFTVGLVDFVNQVDALRPLLVNHAGPMVVAGDFNTWSNNRKSHLEDFMASHDLVAVDFSPDHRTTFWQLPLDHVYVRGLRSLDARTVPVETSDHNPILVTLKITQ